MGFQKTKQTTKSIRTISNRSRDIDDDDKNVALLSQE